MNKDWIGNNKSMSSFIGMHNQVGESREQSDYYATQPTAAEWLIKLEELDDNIWECACGEGHLSKVFETHGFNVRSTDLVDRGFGQGGVDFLQCSEPWNGDIVTNPPYKYAQEFIEHALSLVENGNKVCMFLKVQFLEGKRRERLYKDNPPKTIWVSRARIKCGKNGNFSSSSMVAFAWYVWEKGYHGETVIKWFN